MVGKELKTKRQIEAWPIFFDSRLIHKMATKSAIPEIYMTVKFHELTKSN